jgi:hypothetical protein
VERCPVRAGMRVAFSPHTCRLALASNVTLAG